LTQGRDRSDATKYNTATVMSTSALKHSAKILALSFLVFWNCASTLCLAQSETQGNNDTLSLCFLSDTQEPMFFERHFLKYNGNAKARKSIFEKICELKPEAVVHLGDLVSAGSDNGSWGDVDQFVRRLHDQKIEFLPIPGNHEYLFSSKKGIPNFASRYPYAKLGGYARQFADVAVVLINSNFGELSEDERSGQLHRYQETLSDFEKNPSIDFVIVGCHRPPFTNSKIVSGSKEIRDYYLPEFYRCSKCRLFLSGHAHTYEHFRINGKDFLVIGGGGGLQHPLRTGEKAKYKDIFSDSTGKRMFHFVMIKSYHDTLAVELKMLRTDLKSFESLPQLFFVRDGSSKGGPGE
jgi:3',5'-cyclic AMP phosphodiesterase CpdA